VALLTNIHYQPYLNQVFPEGRGIWLAPDMGKPDGGFMLEIIPLPSSQPEVLQHWIQAGRAFHGLAGEVFDNHDWKPRAPIVQSLIAMVPYLGSDPFLKSCFWEKIAENEYVDRHYAAQMTAFQQAIERGIPAAHLYNSLGALYLRRGHLKEARRAFQKALQCVPNHTSAAAGLKILDEVEKTGTAPTGIP
jgi:tetratricopeptide (TPR) repeat protein